MRFHTGYWALILGGSSGFGLATAEKLSQHGMNICVVHRDRRGAMGRIEPRFEEIRANGVSLLTFNRDALDVSARNAILDELKEHIGSDGGVRVMMHSIALGNLKPLALQERATAVDAVSQLAAALQLDPAQLGDTVRQLFVEGVDALHTLVKPTDGATNRTLDEDDFAQTIYAMGTSLVGWVKEMVERRLFTADARVVSMTSEGNTVAWRGYAAVSAAKAVLEAISRSLAVEFAPYGIRTNVVQAGVTDTPALRHIPGSDRLKASGQLRNPFGRLTKPEDVANVIYLLCTDEAAWINGALIRADGGEHISGV